MTEKPLGYPYGWDKTDQWEGKKACIASAEVVDFDPSSYTPAQKPKFTPANLISRLRELALAGVELAKRKNQDYATETDPWKNFRAAALYGVNADRAILIRMADKMARISTLLDKLPSVDDESVLETCSDLANYALLLRVWLEQKGNE